MKQKFRSIPCFFSFLVAFSFVELASAEFVCTSEVSYKWIKQTSDADEVGSGSVATASGPPKAGPTPKSPEAAAERPQPVPSNMRFATVERAGRDEVAAKSALAVEVTRQKARASERCKRDHENFGECLATKLSVKSSVLNSLSFSTRSQVESAITEECKGQQGTCLSVDSSEPACREVVASARAGAEPAAAASSEAGKKAGAPDKGADKGKQQKKK